MSNIYVQEPPTEGKVCLETSVGDIDIELWSRECPKACRNFIQLCLEGYYDKTKFHRVVSDFIVQGGDPTGTGQGGESIWGHPFKDEFHSRLRFVRRGLVAMANAGKDDNGSQFFFTLGAAKELQSKHTIFGKVVGDTIHNMTRLAEGYIEDGDRPKYPHKIIKTNVLVNPFKDIVPRMSIQQEASSKKEKPKSKMKATKDYKLLSFGEEAEEDEEDIDRATDKKEKGKGKSAHDLTNDPKLSSSDGSVMTKTGSDSDEGSDDSDAAEDDLERKEAARKREEQESIRHAEEVDSIRNKLKRKTDDKQVKSKKSGANEFDFDDDDDPDLREKKKRREEIKRELKALSKELRGGKDDKEKEVEEIEEKAEVVTEEEKNNDMLLSYHQEQKKYKEKSFVPPKKKASREEETLAMLAKFKNKLSSFSNPEEEKDEKETKEIEEEDDDDITGDSWMNNTLKFENNDPVLAKDASTKDDDWFDIYDPRNPLNKRRREKDQQDGTKAKKDAKKMTL